MKKGMIITIGLALAGAALYFWRFRKAGSKTALPEKENERRHLTTIFSKAKEMATEN